MRSRSNPRRGSVLGVVLDFGAALFFLLPVALILHFYTGWRTNALRAANPDRYCVVQDYSDKFEPVSPVFRTLKETEDWAVANGFWCTYASTVWEPPHFNLRTEWPRQVKTVLVKSRHEPSSGIPRFHTIYHIVGDLGEDKWVSIALEHGEGKSGIDYSRFRRIKTYDTVTYGVSKHPIEEQVEIPRKDWKWEGKE